jgi:hypothetical protein
LNFASFKNRFLVTKQAQAIGKEQNTITKMKIMKKNQAKMVLGQMEKEVCVYVFVFCLLFVVCCLCFVFVFFLLHFVIFVLFLNYQDGSKNHYKNMDLVVGWKFNKGTYFLSFIFIVHFVVFVYK